ncbi:MAG TPA: rhodanese-like domain-containing protein [Chitinophagaceae bacterium]|nr:rhodanese-like domain-containing protein [Chitinophagaceae bacterium]
MTLKEITKNSTTKFVDVRSEMEFKSGHVKGAVNIPLDQFQRRYDEIKGLGKTPVVFYCRSGNRSGQAVGYLRQMGIENIYNGGALEDLQYYLN